MWLPGQFRYSLRKRSQRRIPANGNSRNTIWGFRTCWIADAVHSNFLRCIKSYRSDRGLDGWQYHCMQGKAIKWIEIRFLVWSGHIISIPSYPCIFAGIPHPSCRTDEIGFGFPGCLGRKMASNCTFLQYNQRDIPLDRSSSCTSW